MNRKIIVFLLCGTLLLSAAGCGASGKQANADLSKPVEETAEEVDAAVMDEAGDKLQEVEDSLSDASLPDVSAEVEESLPEAAEEIIEESESEASASDDAESEANASDDAASGSEDYDAAYAFVNVKFDGDKLIVVPNGTVNDSTLIYEDKTLGGLCDYIDSTVLEEGRTINRDFLYDLISVEVIDPQLYQDYDSFSRTLCMSLSIANEFSTIDVDLKDMILDTTNQAKQTFEVTAEGKDTSWILDGHEYKFYLNDGSTEYTSSMFDPETLAVWSVVLDQYFEVEG
jgi:hypothetical protein